MFFIIVLALLSHCVDQSHSIRCYQGFDSFGPTNSRNVSLKECPASSQCCYMISSLPGSTYGCYSLCPGPAFRQCGPGPSLYGPQDVGWCYCKTENDTLCMPSYFAPNTTASVPVAASSSAAPTTTTSTTAAQTSTAVQNSISTAAVQSTGSTGAASNTISSGLGTAQSTGSTGAAPNTILAGLGPAQSTGAGTTGSPQTATATSSGSSGTTNATATSG